MSAISVSNVSKTFEKGKVKALDCVSFSVEPGEIFGLLGANGAGKTTMISILCGLLSKDSGDIQILGMDIDKSIQEIKKKTAIVTGFTMVTVSLSVREYLTYFAMLHDVKKDRVLYAVKMLDLEKKFDERVRDLSSGYKQRVLLAKALLNSPKIIYLDEPTVGLDVGIAIKIRSLISELKKKGTTIIFTSHNLTEVEQLCDRIALIQNGKIKRIGTIEDIKQSIRNNKLVEVSCKRTEDMLEMVKLYKEVESAKICSGKVVIEAKKAKDVDKIMSRIINSDHLIISIRRIEPSLEEAFLNIMQ